MIAALTALFLTVAEPVKLPDLGFDYREMILKHTQAVADGKGEHALEVMDAVAFATDWFKPEARETTKKHYARIYGAAGKHSGSEIVGYKRITSRVVRVYAVSHFETAVITYSFVFLKNGKDEWRLFAYQVQEGIEELEKLSPFQPTSAP